MQSQRVHQAIFHLTDPLPCDISNVMSKKELATKTENVSVAARLVAQAEVAKLVYKPSEDTLVVGSTVIHRSANGLFNLNDLHKASGALPKDRPPSYIRSVAAQRLIKALEKRYGPGVHETVVGGTSPGTYAHKTLAYAYAAWLDDEYMILALEILDEVTNQVVDKVQEAFTALSDKYGEAVALQHKTVAELGQAYKDLNIEKDCNNQLIFAHRDVKKLQPNSPIVHELGLARNNVEHMYFNLDQAQRQLINCYDFLDSLQRSVQQEANQPHVNNYYKKFFKSTVIDPIQSEFPDLKDCITLNVKVLEAAKDYIATASKTVQAPEGGEDGKS